MEKTIVYSKLQYIWVDYLKAPQHIRLTQEQIDLTQDTSQIMEFPDYVCQEIINELVMIVMENSSDPRTQTHIQQFHSLLQIQLNNRHNHKNN